ncbi:MAG: alkylmercury lyase family protein [Pseudomonadota bacterium]
MELNNASLHFVIIDTFLKRGYAPTVDELAGRFVVERSHVCDGLKRLQDYHGVVLHPDSLEIWVAHPFSTVPTGFLVTSGDREWWGNCAWCSLGLAALAKQPVIIKTSPGYDRPPVELLITNDQLQNDQFVVHFPIPMAQAWDNVIAICSVMLLFDDETHVDEWCAKHGKQKGDVRPVGQVWEFAKDWYGKHADPDWKKPTVSEAAELFARHGLAGPIWTLPEQDKNF